MTVHYNGLEEKYWFKQKNLRYREEMKGRLIIFFKDTQIIEDLQVQKL